MAGPVPVARAVAVLQAPGEFLGRQAALQLLLGLLTLLLDPCPHLLGCLPGLRRWPLAELPLVLLPEDHLSFPVEDRRTLLPLSPATGGVIANKLLGTDRATPLAAKGCDLRDRGGDKGAIYRGGYLLFSTLLFSPLVPFLSPSKGDTCPPLASFLHRHKVSTPRTLPHIAGKVRDFLTISYFF